MNSDLVSRRRLPFLKRKVLMIVSELGLASHQQIEDRAKLDVSVVEVVVDQLVFDSYLYWEKHADVFYYRLSDNGLEFLEGDDK